MEAFVGTIVPFAINFQIDGWLPCDGSLQQIATYQALFALIGTNYGGDGVSTFGMPDLRDATPIGYGQGPSLPNYLIGQKGGANTVTLDNTNMPLHIHTATFTPTGTAPAATITAVLNGVNATGTQINPGGGFFANNHTITNGNYIAPGGTPVAMAPGSLTVSGGGGQSTGGSITVSTVGGTNPPVNILQPYQAVSYQICWSGIFPTRN